MPATATPPGEVASLTVDADTVAAFSGSETWATGATVTLDSVAPFDGVIDTTVGGVVSAVLVQVEFGVGPVGVVVAVAVAVVGGHGGECGGCAVVARWLPARSAMPEAPPMIWSW